MVNTAVILAAGISARLNDSTAEKPKGFLEIDGKSLIERSLTCLHNHAIENIIIGTGYQSDHYDRLAGRYSGVRTYKCDHYRTTSSFFTLFNMKHLIKDDFLLLESDLIYEKRAISHLLASPDPDIILASGLTHSQDEVFIETAPGQILHRMSKNITDLKSVYGELVGISKISVMAFQRVCKLLEADASLLRSIEYEYALTMLSKTHPIKIDKIEDLVWAEIDTQEHLERVRTLIYPKLVKLNQSV